MTDERTRASEARHGGRFLTGTLAESINRRTEQWLVVGGRWAQREELRLALAGDHHSITVEQAWMEIDRPLFPDERASVHIARIRAEGFGRARREYLDEAIHWPVIRVALGLPL